MECQWITHRPNRNFLLRVKTEVFVRQLGWSDGLETKICPTLKKPKHRFKRVQSDTIAAIVRHVGHEDGDLKIGSISLVHLA